MQIFQERSFVKEVQFLLKELPIDIWRDIIDPTSEIIQELERQILEEIRESYIKPFEKELLWRWKQEGEKNKIQIITLQFLLSKLWYYEALSRERKKWDQSSIFHFLEKHNNPLVKKALANYNDQKKRRDGERVNGILDSETTLALTYFQYQNLGKDVKNADGLIWPKTMEVVIKDLKVRKI